MAKVIICTVAYNAEKTLHRTIDSILAQTFCDWEYHILDNGSTDKTGMILSEYTKADDRIFAERIDKNDIMAGTVFVPKICSLTDAEYFCWIDSDDEYKSDFLEKMMTFVTKNNLKVAACGYEMIDAISGAVIKRKTYDGNFLIEGNDFTAEFVRYRGFTVYLWAKLFSTALICEAFEGLTAWENSLDSIVTLRSFQLAKRAGVYGEPLYKYYIYKGSCSHSLILGRFKMDKSYYHHLQDYLLCFGEISKTNQDFLYAILLSLVEDTVSVIFSSKLSTLEKMKRLDEVFSDSDVKSMLNCDADPQFNNLSRRPQFVQKMKSNILALCDGSKDDALVNRLLSIL